MDETEYLKIINACINKENGADNIFITKEMLNGDLKIIDYCLDFISDELALKGFDDNSEPNEYGIALEEVVGYLLDFRYRLEAV